MENALMKTILFTIVLMVACDGMATIHYLTPSASIQLTVEAAGDGDTLLLDEGVYTESVVLHGKTLTLGSLYLVDRDTSHISQTRIIADTTRPDTNSCIVYAYGERLEGRLVGLTMVGGRGTRLSYIDSTSGGGICVRLSAVSVENCVIRDCEAGRGGGIFIWGLGSWSYAAMRLTGCRIQACQAGLYGGGMYADQCSLLVRTTTFEGDTSVLDGGGLLGSELYVTADSCVFRTCIGLSGGLDCVGNAAVSVSNSLFERNGSAGSPLGCHLNLAGCTSVVVRCVFRENTGEEIPVHISGGTVPTTFLGNLVEDNVATRHSGILVTGGSSFGQIAFNVFRNNTSVTGGAVTTYDHSRIRVHHNYFSNNISLMPDYGTVLTSISDARPTLDSNLIEIQRGQAVTIYPDYPVTIVARNNYWGDPSGPYHPTLNPNGRGDTLLSDSVLFIPWLTAPPDTTMPNSVLEHPVPVASTWKLLAVYPNPFNSEIRLVIAGFTSEDFRITLHNLLGQRVDVIHEGALTGGELHYCARATLASGVYFVRASAGDGAQTEKVIFLK
jgi:hypothetical protein